MGIPLIVGNWKMNKTATEAALFVRELLVKLPIGPDVEIVLAPPFTALDAVRHSLGPSPKLGLGAQNLYWEPQGAFTGEISPLMLHDLGCTYVILGHSERRTLFGESDTDVQKKVRAAVMNGLRPILCIGESLTEREAGRMETIVTEQVTAALAGLTDRDLASVTIAYEPVWAIGTGRAATTEQVVTAHRAIRACIDHAWNGDLASGMRILYGGSVTPQNAEALLSAESVDGALVGGACLKTESFVTIAHAARKIRKR